MSSLNKNSNLLVEQLDGLVTQLRTQLELNAKLLAKSLVIQEMYETKLKELGIDTEYFTKQLESK